jgi:hypothetical protein
MRAAPSTSRARRSRAKPKKRKAVISQRERIRRRRHRQAYEVIGMRCRVLQVEPDAEAIVLTEPVSGQRFSLPLVSPKRDGQIAASFQPLAGHDVWLSVRIG